jgi:hypothetical protein
MSRPVVSMAPDDHPTGDTGVAEGVVVLVLEPEMAGQGIEPMRRQLGPGVAGDLYAVEPAAADHRQARGPAGGRERGVIEV